MGKEKHKKSIRTRLVWIFVMVLAAVFALNGCLYFHLNRTLRELDKVYESNIRLNEASFVLSKLQDALYQYLSTKSSDSLENYYSRQQDYQNMLEDFNQKTVSDPIRLGEKNIYNMSLTYLQKAGNAVEAKRGRNIAKYRRAYAEAKQVYDFLQSNISSMNMKMFLENSKNYLRLRRTLAYTAGIGAALLIGVVVLAAVWIVYMTRNLTKPLIELAEAADEIAAGKIEVDFPAVETQDEVGTVARACNKMIESIRAYIGEIKENYERESRLIENELNMKNDLKEAQLKYLQAQINPHFLFNSLNAGAQLAMMEGAEKSCVFIQNMADFFRYNVRKMDTDTTLAEELRLVDSYIYILNVRFLGDIHYDKQIDERLLRTAMPGMILQPVIENAVNHGIRGMEGKGRIWTSVYGEGENICVKIADNGKGIDPITARRLIKGESVPSGDGKDLAGVGLDNVLNRLKRYYGADRVMDIRAREGGGTEVILYIPKKRG